VQKEKLCLAGEQAFVAFVERLGAVCELEVEDMAGKLSIIDKVGACLTGLSA